MLQLLLLLITFNVWFQVQSDKQIFSEELNGILHSSEGIIFIIGDDYYELSNTDFYEEYYRMIYNDSTITNPNTELKSNYNLNFLPFIAISQHHYQKYMFNEPMNLGVFLQTVQSGGYHMTEFGQSIIDSLLNK